MSLQLSFETAASRPYPFVIRLLLVATVIYLAFFIPYFIRIASDGYGYMFLPGVPFGIDFINIWSAGNLVLSDAVDTIYSPEAFNGYQNTMAGESIELRLWAYPPHSLMLVWPFALGGYHLMYALWSLLGLGLLAFAARRFGFGWAETLILMLSPASLQCVLLGQSGNVACALLLIAFSGSAFRKTPASALAAALLTIKPQIGFLLPIFWLLQRRWTLIFATGVLTAALVAVSLLWFGTQAWQDYVGVTLPALAAIERDGIGGFVYIIPSVFMSLRLMGFAGSDAHTVHMVFAALIFVALLWRLRKAQSSTQQISLILIGTCLITPYLHFYDLGILLAGALMLLQRGTEAKGYRLAAAIAVSLAWILPVIILPLGKWEVPISPILILGMFVTAAMPTGSARLA